MRVPDHQNQIPGDNRPRNSAGAGRPSEDAFIDRSGATQRTNRIYRAEKTLPSEIDESANDVDAVEVSAFSLELLTNIEPREKVEALQKLYDEGNYIVDPEQLAKSIVDSHLSESEPYSRAGESSPDALG